MFFLSDVIEFKRRKGSKNRIKKQKNNGEKRENIKTARNVTATGIGVSKEARGWLRLATMFM